MINIDIKDELSELNEEMLFADGFDDALLGTVMRCGMNTVALYDSDKCIQILMENDDMTYEEALEYFEYNVLGSYVGENTPMFANLYK